MNNDFRSFLQHFLGIWKSCSLHELKDVISQDYKAREITSEGVVDFGYEESVEGWRQGFSFIKENHAEWDLKELKTFPLKEQEWMAIIWAAPIIKGKAPMNGHLFFDTFKPDNDAGWKLVRSYIETDIPFEHINETLLKGKMNKY